MTDPLHIATDPDEVRNIGLADVVAILEDEQLEYRLEETVLRTGFVNAAMAFTTDGNKLLFEAAWRGAFALDDASSLLFATNEYNQSRFAPTLRFFQSDENTLMITGVRSVDIGRGMSTNQLGTFVLTSINAAMEAFDFLKASFPAAVTWEETR